MSSSSNSLQALHSHVSPQTGDSSIFQSSTDFLQHGTKSLEMCTEILGCETGCHGYLVPDTTPERLQSSSCIKPRKTCKKTTKHSSSFPPPLTSISSGVRVQARHGGGRLVITAFISRVHFKSERENGRLRLFLNNYRRSEAENIKEKIGCSYKCGDGSGSKNITSLPVCVVASS